MSKLATTLLACAMLPAASPHAVAQSAPQSSATGSQPAPIVRSFPNGDAHASQGYGADQREGYPNERDYRDNDRTGPIQYPEYSYAGGPYGYGYPANLYAYGSPYGYGYPYAYGYPYGIGFGFGYPRFYGGFGGPYRYGYGYRGSYGYGGGIRGGFGGSRDGFGGGRRR